MRRKKSIKPKTHKTKSNKKSSQILSFQRIIIISSVLLVGIAIVALNNQNTITKSVAGVSVARGMFEEIRVGWEKDENAQSYNLYYKQKKDKTYTHSVRDIPTSITEYSVSYLLKGKEYDFQLASVGADGKEFGFRNVHVLSAPQSM